MSKGHNTATGDALLSFSRPVETLLGSWLEFRMFNRSEPIEQYRSGIAVRAVGYGYGNVV